MVLTAVLQLSGYMLPETWAEKTLRALTLREKIGQLFSVNLFGEFYPNQSEDKTRLLRLVQEWGIGGVIFFQSDPLEQATLTNQLQEAAKIPLWVSQDMENGVGMRVRRATAFPTAMALGATRNPDLAYQMGQLVAKEALALGVHQNYAPVADVNNNPRNPIINVRSYGERPALVAAMSSAYARGMQDGGLMATAKHFPGHGDTATDSHADLPILPFTKARLDSLELVPFREMIASGIQSVMVGHLAVPAFSEDSTTAATLSPALTTQLLQEQLGFRGLIVTDALQMQGIAKHYGSGEAAIRAIEAGADMLLMPQDVETALPAILNAITSGRLTETRIDASVLKILRAKEKAGLHLQKTVSTDHIFDVLNAPEHQSLALTIARQALTLVRNERNVLPMTFSGKRSLVIALNDDDDPKVNDLFMQTLRRARIQADVVLVDRRSPESSFEAIIRQAERYDQLLIPAYIAAHANLADQLAVQKLKSLLAKLVQLGKPAVFISFGSPYLTMALPQQPDAVLMAYGADPATLQATTEALEGQIPIQGKLPVTVPDLYPYRTGLQTDQFKPYSFAPMTTDSLYAPINRLIKAAIQNQAFPGAAVAFGTRQYSASLAAYGYQTYTSDRKITVDDQFDLASLTKVIGLTTAVMKLYEEGKLGLDDKVTKYVPEFGKNGKDVLTVRHLMTHSGGLKPFYAFYNMGIDSREGILDYIFNDKLYYTPGSKMEYSDLDMIMMGLIVERISGLSLDEYLQVNFWRPMGLTKTGFRKTRGAGDDPAAVPTENDTYYRKKQMQGEVHDECAWVLGGTSGHAGLFSSAHDLAQFAHMILNGGAYNGKQYLKPETIALFTKVQNPALSTRGLGWDTKPASGYTSAGSTWGARSFGHTGFTGTSIWIDPDAGFYAILLTNRVYPTRENMKIRDVRNDYGNAVRKILLSLKDREYPVPPKRPNNTPKRSDW